MNKKIRVPFNRNEPATEWIREKYKLGPMESSVSLFEIEFKCKVTWEYGHCFLSFADERDAVMYLLRWT